MAQLYKNPCKRFQTGPLAKRSTRALWGFVLAIFTILMSPYQGLCEEVTLRSGNVLSGTIVEQNKDYLILDHPDLGRLTMPAKVVKSISQTGAVDTGVGQHASIPAQTAPKELISKPKKEEVKDVVSVPHVTPKRLWALSLVFGGAFTNDDEGEKINFNTRFLANRKKPDSETAINFSYIYKLDNSEVDENNFVAIFNQNWLQMTSQWLYFATARYDYDDFRSWQHRIQAHGGAGYRFIIKKNLKLIPIIGLGFRKDINSEEEAFPLEGLLGTRLSWETESRQKLSYELSYYRELNDDNFRVVNIADWKIPIGKGTKLNLDTHIDHEYASDPDPGFPHNNIRFIWGLQWTF